MKVWYKGKLVEKEDDDVEIRRKEYYKVVEKEVEGIIDGKCSVFNLPSDEKELLYIKLATNEPLTEKEEHYINTVKDAQKKRESLKKKGEELVKAAKEGKAVAILRGSIDGKGSW